MEVLDGIPYTKHRVNGRGRRASFLGLKKERESLSPNRFHRTSERSVGAMPLVLGRDYGILLSIGRALAGDSLLDNKKTIMMVER